MIDLLLDKDNPQSQVLLNTFVFKIIPNLNPDGLARGYWRNDTTGTNLNRHYLDPSKEEHPTIYGALKAIEHAH